MTRVITTFCLVIISAAFALAQSGGDKYLRKSEKYGIAVLTVDNYIPTPRELPAAVAKRQQELLELAHAYPEDFNYPWIDWKTGEVVIDVKSETGNQSSNALQNESQVKHRTRKVKYSWADLKRISYDVLSAEKKARFPELEVVRATEIDWKNNRLVLLVDKVSDELLKVLAKQYQTDSIAVCSDNVPIASPANKPASRVASIFSPATILQGGPQWETRESYSRWRVWGGSNVNGCTNGFSWYYGGDVYGMITAGHCFSTGGNASAPVDDRAGDHIFGWVWGGHWENWHDDFGTTPFDPPSVGGQAGDMASIQMQQYSLENARIFRTNTLTSPVKQMGTNSINNSLCTSGRVSGNTTGGEICGWVVDRLWTDVPVAGVEGAFWRDVHTAYKASGPCIERGDSGGPVYYVRTANEGGGIMAKGIINGFGTYPGRPGCFLIYTDIQTAKWTFGGTLHTQ